MAAVSVDAPPTSRGLSQKLGLEFPLVSDPQRTLIRAFGLEDEANETAWPAVYVIAPDGTVAFRSLSETYKERPPPPVLMEQLDRLAGQDAAKK